MTTNEHGTIHTLGDRGLTVDGSLNDVRGREVVAADGHTIGTVAEHLVDDERTRSASCSSTTGVSSGSARRTRWSPSRPSRRSPTTR